MTSRIKLSQLFKEQRYASLLKQLPVEWNNLTESERGYIYHLFCANRTLGGANNVSRTWVEIDASRPIILGAADTHRHRGQTGYDLLSKIIDD